MTKHQLMINSKIDSPINSIFHANHLKYFFLFQPPKKIDGVKFTPREIDVIACLLSGRGTKKTALLLTIKEKTVETHKNNIMRKMDCNSKDSIIDFIEKSDHFYILREHYLRLLNMSIFYKSLLLVHIPANTNKYSNLICRGKNIRVQPEYLFHFNSNNNDLKTNKIS